MRDFWFLCLLIGTMAWAQAKPAAVSATQSRPPAADMDDENKLNPRSASSVAADAPVLTIRGLCDQAGPNAEAHSTNSGCQTVVTRAQFERLAEALHAGNPSSRRQLGKAYPQFLVLAHEAEQRGLDKQPRFAEKIRFARLQILSQELMREIQEEADQVLEEDIEDYYRKNNGEFELASLERIVIPNGPQIKPPSNQHGAEQSKPVEDVMARTAELLRGRAVAGEDFTRLQKEAYDAAGVSGNNAPNPTMDKMRRRSLPPAHASVFDLKPGQVSQVISDPTGRYIYKLDSTGMESLDAVKLEISNTLRAQRMKKMMQGLQQPFTTDVNQAYFGDTGANSD